MLPSLKDSTPPPTTCPGPMGLPFHATRRARVVACSVVVPVTRARQDITGSEVEEMGFAAGISLNKNLVPGDTRPPRVTSGIRVGTAAVTTRGMGSEAMEALAGMLVGMIRGENPESFRGHVRELCSAYPLPASPTTGS